jgi:hypothetical protein
MMDLARFYPHRRYSQVARLWPDRNLTDSGAAISVTDAMLAKGAYAIWQEFGNQDAWADHASTVLEVLRFALNGRVVHIDWDDAIEATLNEVAA